MTGWAEALVAGVLALGAPVAGPAVASAGVASAGDGPAHAVKLFSFTDPAIIESSGLADTGRQVLTVNDSGDTARIFRIDPASGDTVGVTEYARGAVDVEALAPGPRGALWVGDIGDNRRERSTVSVYRVSPSGRTEELRLRYPGGPRDAEALLVHPHSGRMFVVSKSPLGGTVYAVPPQPVPGVNRLRHFATVPGLVTDGAFFPDGRHVVLRGFGTASVYTFPAFDLVGTVRLPDQPQGEGISVGPDGRVLVSSEGLHAAVFEVRIPDSLLGGAAEDRAPAQPAPTPPPPDPPWVGIAVVGAGGVALGLLVLRAARPRSPRSQ